MRLRRRWWGDFERVRVTEIEPMKKFLNWIGVRDDLTYTDFRTIGPGVGFLLAILVVTVSIAALTTLIEFLKASLHLGRYASDTDGSALRNIGLILIALFGAPFVIWRTIAAAQQARVAVESLLNAKILAASEGLSARREVTRQRAEDGEVIREIEDDLISRSVGIDSLEGLISERPETAPRIIRMLAAYVRSSFPVLNLEPSDPPFERKIPRLDLQRAVDLIGRVQPIARQFDRSNWRLDLANCDFDGVSFREGNFYAVDFSGSRFEAADFRNADLDGAWLNNCLLNFSTFFKTNLTGAKFHRSTMTYSEGFLDCQMKGISFLAANLSGIDYLGPKEEIEKTFGTYDTNLSSHMQMQVPELDVWRRAALSQNTNNALSEDDIKYIEQLRETGFTHWSPFESSDMATNWYLSRFYGRLEMARWPYF